jgi:hypothetical protein
LRVGVLGGASGAVWQAEVAVWLHPVTFGALVTLPLLDP